MIDESAGVRNPEDNWQAYRGGTAKKKLQGFFVGQMRSAAVGGFASQAPTNQLPVPKKLNQ